MSWRLMTTTSLLLLLASGLSASILPGDERHHDHDHDHHDHQEQQQGYPQTAADPPKFYAPPPQAPDTLYNAPEAPVVAASESKPAFALPAPATTPAPETTTMMMMDASYDFGYTADASSRAESADPAGNVVGTYAYTSPDGNQLEVRYRAGADTGFVVENQEELDEFILKSAAAHDLETAESNNDLEVTNYSGELADSLSFRQATINEEDWTPNSDWAFSYDSSSGAGSRSEQASQDGGVEGSYTTMGADGQLMEVRYRAGPEIGFVILNNDEVAANSVPALSEEHYAAIADLDAASSAAVEANFKAATAAAAAPASSASEQIGGGNDYDDYEAGVYSPYSFDFQSSEDGSTRSESASDDGVVRGEYSYLTPAGSLISVRYNAGPDTGFVIENADELAAAVERATYEESVTAADAATSATAGVAANFNAASAASAAPASSAFGSNYDNDVVVVAKNFAPGIQEQIGGGNDYENFTTRQEQIGGGNDYDDYAEGVYSPYSFDFQSDEDSSTRTESAGDDGIVRGEYSYLTPAGSQISVQYSAGPDTGFVIENADELAAAVEKATYEESASAADAYAATSAPAAAPAAVPIGFVRQGAAPATVPVAFVRSLNPEPVSVSAVQPERRRRIVMKKLVKRKRVSANSLSGSNANSFNNFPYSGVASSQKSFETSTYPKQTPSVNLPVMNEREYSAQHVAASSFSYSSAGDHEHSREEHSDGSGEVTGQYSYVSPEGRSILVRYRAGKNGFEILNPEEVYGPGNF